MFIVFLFFVAAVALPAGGVIVGLWWALALIFGIPAPSPDQSHGIVLGTVVLAEGGGAALYAVCS